MSTLVLTFVFILCSILYFLLAARRRSQHAATGSPLLPPGSLGLPFFGDYEFGLYLKNPAEWNRRKVKRYGDIFKANVFFRKNIMLSRPEDNYWVLKVP